MSTRKKIFYGISVDYLGSILATIISFAVVPVYFKYVSIEEYGVWLAIQGVIGMIAIAEFGGDIYLTTKIADNSVFNSSSELTTQISTMVFLKFLLSLFFISIGAVVYFFLNEIITSKIDISMIQNVFLLSLIILISCVYFSTISTILSARHHYVLVNSVASTFAILTSLLSLLLLASGFGVVAFALSMLICTIIQNVILFSALIKNYPFIRIRLASISLSSVRETYQYSKNFYLLRLSFMIRTNYIVLAISHLTSTSFVTIYNITNRIPSTIPSYISKITVGLFPSFAELYAVGNMQKLKEVYLKLSKIIWRLSIFSFIVVVGFNKEFVKLWVGVDKYGGFWVMLFLSLSMAMLAANGPLGVIVYAIGKYERWPMWAGVEMALSIILSYLFFTIWGFEGIVFGFLVSASVTAIYLFNLVHRILEIDTIDFFKNIWSYILIPNLSTVCFVIAIDSFGVNSWQLLITSLIFIAIFHILLYDGIKILCSKEPTFKKRVAEALVGV